MLSYIVEKRGGSFEYKIWTKDEINREEKQAKGEKKKNTKKKLTAIESTDWSPI